MGDLDPTPRRAAEPSEREHPALAGVEVFLVFERELLPAIEPFRPTRQQTLDARLGDHVVAHRSALHVDEADLGAWVDYLADAGNERLVGERGAQLGAGGYGLFPPLHDLDVLARHRGEASAAGRSRWRSRLGPQPSALRTRTSGAARRTPATRPSA